jgi:carbonic anhydrase/acetyltransferase-like protein (isoleucine patch superfamily)
MPLFSFEGHSPKIAPTAFVAPTATVIGDVTIEAGASVWFNTVLRASPDRQSAAGGGLHPGTAA